MGIWNSVTSLCSTLVPCGSSAGESEAEARFKRCNVYRTIGAVGCLLADVAILAYLIDNSITQDSDEDEVTRSVWSSFGFGALTAATLHLLPNRSHYEDEGLTRLGAAVAAISTQLVIDAPAAYEINTQIYLNTPESPIYDTLTRDVPSALFGFSCVTLLREGISGNFSYRTVDAEESQPPCELETVANDVDQSEYALLLQADENSQNEFIKLPFGNTFKERTIIWVAGGAIGGAMLLVGQISNEVLVLGTLGVYWLGFTGGGGLEELVQKIKRHPRSQNEGLLLKIINATDDSFQLLGSVGVGILAALDNQVARGAGGVLAGFLFGSQWRRITQTQVSLLNELQQSRKGESQIYSEARRSGRGRLFAASKALVGNNQINTAHKVWNVTRWLTFTTVLAFITAILATESMNGSLGIALTAAGALPVVTGSYALTRWCDNKEIPNASPWINLAYVLNCATQLPPFYFLAFTTQLNIGSQSLENYSNAEVIVGAIIAWYSLLSALAGQQARAASHRSYAPLERTTAMTALLAGYFVGLLNGTQVVGGGSATLSEESVTDVSRILTASFLEN